MLLFCTFLTLVSAEYVVSKNMEVMTAGTQKLLQLLEISYLLENTNLHLHIPFCQNSDINLYILESKCISANQTSSRTQALLILFPWDLLNRKMDLIVEYFPQSIFRLHNYIFHKFQKIFQKKQKHPSAHFWQIWLSSDCATEPKKLNSFYLY